jgi:hypothetical protein
MRTTRKIGRPIARVLCGTAVIVLVEASQAAPPSPAQRCQATKLVAAGSEARNLLLCARRHLAAGTDPACIAAAAQRRNRAFSRAEARGGCDTTGDSPDVGAETSALLDDALAALRPGGPAPSRCTQAQLAALGRAIAKIALAYSRDRCLSEFAPYPAAVSEALADAESAFARASVKGDCLATTSAQQAEAILIEAVRRLRGKLCPAYGDGVRTASEECDGGDAASCNGPCQANCTCPAQTCGNGLVEPGEQCDGASCPGTEPGEYGCFAPGSGNGCQCCAETGACYIRGFGAVTPVEVPCCSGTCNIPGLEAGPDVMVFCTQPPPEPCPCFTSATLDATFPPGFFDENGRGGAVCDPPESVGIAAADTCFLARPVGGGFDLTRSGAAVVGGSSCTLFVDLDPDNTGFCSGPPLLTGITPAQAAGCIGELQASEIYQTECP